MNRRIIGIIVLFSLVAIVLVLLPIKIKYQIYSTLGIEESFPPLSGQPSSLKKFFKDASGSTPIKTFMSPIVGGNFSGMLTQKKLDTKDGGAILIINGITVIDKESSETERGKYSKQYPTLAKYLIDNPNKSVLYTIDITKNGTVSDAEIRAVLNGSDAKRIKWAGIKIQNYSTNKLLPLLPLLIKATEYEVFYIPKAIKKVGISGLDFFESFLVNATDKQSSSIALALSNIGSKAFPLIMTYLDQNPENDSFKIGLTSGGLMYGNNKFTTNQTIQILLKISTSDKVRVNVMSSFASLGIVTPEITKIVIGGINDKNKSVVGNAAVAVKRLYSYFSEEERKQIIKNLISAYTKISNIKPTTKTKPSIENTKKQIELSLASFGAATKEMIFDAEKKLDSSNRKERIDASFLILTSGVNNSDAVDEIITDLKSSSTINTSSTINIRGLGKNIKFLINDLEDLIEDSDGAMQNKYLIILTGLVTRLDKSNIYYTRPSDKDWNEIMKTMDSLIDELEDIMNDKKSDSKIQIAEIIIKMALLQKI